MLRDSHRGIKAQLDEVVRQLQAQSESTFGGNKQPWSAVSDPAFGNDLIKYGKALIALGENFNSGKPPQWHVDQQSAYESSAIGRLQRNKQT